MDKPYTLFDDHILSEKRINQFSLKRLKEEYFKLGERLVESRRYSKLLGNRVNGYRRVLRQMNKRRITVFRRQRWKAAVMRKKIRDQLRIELRKKRIRLIKTAKIKIKKAVQKRVARSRSFIPAKIARVRRRIQLAKNRSLAKSRKTIQRRLSRRTRKAIWKATDRARENAFIGLVKSERNPSIGKYAGVYALVIWEVAKALEMRHSDICCMIWFGNFESFNVGTLSLMYPRLSRKSITTKVNRFEKLGYLQCIGLMMHRKTYTFTPVGKEFYARVYRYMLKFRRPYRNKVTIKKMVRVHFK